MSNYDPQRYAQRRADYLDKCLRVRKRMREPGCPDYSMILHFFQIELLKTRIWRATGRYPETN